MVWLMGYVSLNWEDFLPLKPIFEGAPDYLSSLGDVMLTLLKIAGLLMVFGFLYLLHRKIFEETHGLVILPFDVGKAEGPYSGRAIADMLGYELQRIRDVHNFDFGSYSLVETERLSLPDLVPKTETLDYSIADMGTLNLGSFSLSTGQLVLTIKRLCPGTDPVPVISGSLQWYGSLAAITATLEGKTTRTWQVTRKIREEGPGKDEHIPALIRDLSFKIAHDYPQER
ncbi:MAG: hypothetical protein GKC10_04415 [Methanosarcinales archaeon]|nr:hypothetical protein [Methanosarcinales archaeon]